MRLVLNSPVWENLFYIARHIQSDNPSAANAFIDEAEKAFAFLTTSPHVGRMRTFSIAGTHGMRQKNGGRKINVAN